MNAWTWLFQRISAVVLLIVLGLHIWFLHYAHGGEVLRYSEIIQRLGTPIFVVLDVLLLAFGLYHALYGVYSVFLDFGFRFRSRVVVFCLSIIAGISFLGFGIYGFWVFLNQGV